MPALASPELIIRPVKGVRQHESTGNAFIENFRDHLTRHRRLCGESHIIWHVSLDAPSLVLRPSFGQIEPPVDQRMTEAAGIGGKHTDLAVLHTPGRAGILPCHADRMLPLLHKTGLIHHKHAVGVTKRVDNILANAITKPIRRPRRPAKQRL